MLFGFPSGTVFVNMNHISGAVALQVPIILGSVVWTGSYMCNTKLDYEVIGRDDTNNGITCRFHTMESSGHG